MENTIAEVLTGEARKNALELAAYLRASEMLFERGKGYWEDKFYWMIKYKDEFVCFILINDSKGKTDPWIIWSDDSDSHWFEEFPLDEHIKEIAWKNIDFCGNCGGCSSHGTRKTIFGREFDKVCRTTLKFSNPDADTLECVKKMIEMRKNDILSNAWRCDE